MHAATLLLMFAPHGWLAVLLFAMCGALPLFISLGNIGFDWVSAGGGGGWFDPWTGWFLHMFEIVFVDLGILASFDQALLSADHSVWSGLLKFLKFGWLLGVGGFLSKLISWIQKLQQWLKNHLKGVIQFLQKLRAWLDRYYRQHILPIINLIQRIRRYLLILRLLHIKFADKLDQKLLNFEQRLTSTWLKARGYLNLALTMAGLATNPVSLGRMLIVTIAGRRMMGAAVRAITGLPLGHFFPSSAKGALSWERRPLTTKDYTDPYRNPPASVLLAPLLDSFAEGSWMEGFGPGDGEVDSVEQLPWGEEYIEQLVAGDAALADVVDDPLSIVAMVENQAGLLWGAGQAGAGAVCALVGA